MKKTLSRLLHEKSLKATASALGTAALLATALAAQAGEVLFVSDSATDSNNIPSVLSGGSTEVAHPSIAGAFFRPAMTMADHNVTIIRNDYTVTGGTFGLAEGTNRALAGLVAGVTLADYCSVFWSASGPHEPDGFAGGLGADGGIHNDPAVFASLDAYVAAGGFVLVTGHDAATDPMDTSMEAFLGGGLTTIAAQQLRVTPNASFGAVIMGPNALTSGETTIGGSTPGAVVPGGVNVLDGVQDLDYLAGWDAAQTAAAVLEPLVPGAAMWTIRTPSGIANQANYVNTGHIGYVANGIFLFEDLPFNPGTFLSDGEDGSWIFDPVYNAALRNFAFNSCISLPFDPTKTPVADPQSLSTPLNTPLGITLTGSDPDGGPLPLTFAIDTGPSNGMVSPTTGASVTYTPDPGFFGPDSFTFRVSDGERTSDPATVQIEVLPNTAPDAMDDAYTTDEDTPLTVAAPGVLANDSDVDGDTLTVTGNTSPANGAVTVNADGSFTYTPDANFNGSDSFDYTISDGNGGTDTATVNITVNPVNDPPDAVDDSATTSEDVAVTTNVLANDFDVDGDTLTVTGASNGSNGTTTVNPDATVTYTPAPNFNGSDSYTYDISDGNGGSDTATVNITVIPVNDAPDANDDIAMTDEDVPVTINVLANDVDIDGDILTVTGASNPPNGTATINPDNSITYTPDPDFNGSDSFSYTIGDGNGGSDTAIVTVTVNPVNDPPTANDDSATTNEDVPVTTNVLANDMDVDGDALTVTAASDPANGTATINADNTITYTPDPDYNGVDTYFYTLADGNGGSDTATVTITVNPVNDAPVAADDVYGGTEDIPLGVGAPGVLGNDSDVDGDTLTANLSTGPSNGTLVLNANGSFTYTPNPHFCGSDSFTYQASDSSLLSNTATVTLNIACINDAPVANDDAYSTDEDTALIVAAPGVLANDVDIDGDALTAVLVSGPSNGSLTLNSDGSFSYTPNADYFGSDSFTYKANDGLADSNVATVNITINAVNDAPVIQQVTPLSQTVDYSDNITDVTITATDVDSPVLTLTDSGTPASLSVSGTCVPDNTVPAGTGGSCSWTLSGVINVPQSMHTVGLTVTDDGGLTDSASTGINVEAEDATATLDVNNPAALEVASEGGNSGMFSLTVFTRETLPDNAHAGPAAAGDINKAVVTIVLDPVGPGPDEMPISCTTTSNMLTGYDEVLTTVCDFDNVPVNTYSVVANVNLVGYYTGGDEDALTIFDPSLGFTTGGGWFYWPGTDDRTNFGYTMKYGKNGRNVKGSLLLIRRGDTGKYRIKSNALEGLAIGEGGDPSDPFGWASFSGKATYIEPGWTDAVGNYEFTTYVEDLGEPGAGIDRFWVEVRDKDRNVVPDLSMPEPADANAETISGGNIVVPHTNSGGK